MMVVFFERCSFCHTRLGSSRLLKMENAQWHGRLSLVVGDRHFNPLKGRLRGTYGFSKVVAGLRSTWFPGHAGTWELSTVSGVDSCSFNGHKSRALYDPYLDLTFTWRGTSPWILSLTSHLLLL